MKTNKLFIGLLAAGMLFSCDNNDDVVTNPQSGEFETSYISVDVNSTYNVTRANGYEDGTAEEQKVNNAYFFFFDNAGTPFTVSTEIGGTGTNYIVKTDLSDTGNAPDNVETITNAVLTIKSNKGANPAKMVAVINWDYTGASLPLADLKSTLVAEADAADLTNGFLMSNSVYLSGTAIMDATPITAANISSTEAGATAAPVEVFVERVSAKVNLTQNAESFDTGVENPYGTGNLYAKIIGWDLNTTLSHSNMMKEISSSWTDANLGITGWNIEAFKRSFWGTSAAVSSTNTLAKSFSWAGLTNTVAATDYCLENTSGENAKVLVKAQIVDENGDPVTIVKFQGEYITIDGLKNKIATALASKYYTYDSGTFTYTAIAPTDIDIKVAGTSGVDSYTVTYALSTAAAAMTWKSYDGSTYSDITANDVNSALDALTHAQVWNEGMAYYFTDVKHLGAASSVGEFGVVRNHSYKVNVEGITGLGTPVYSGDTFVDEPVTPVDTESYIAAKINVLSWKLVNSNVTLK